MKKIILVILTIIIVLTGVCAQAQEQPKKTVFIANSYNPENFEWTKNLTEGIISGLKNTGLIMGKDYNIISDTMDALINVSSESRAKEAARILSRIKEVKPDIVLVTDDDALQWIGLKIDNLPVVFNGVNENPTVYLSDIHLDSLKRPGHNVTGVYQTVYVEESINVLKRIKPDVKTFAVITDKSTTGTAVLGFMHILRNTFSLEWKDTLVSNSFPEWQKKINEWQGKVDAIALISANSVADKNGDNIHYSEIIAWIAKNSKLPDFAFWALYVQEGMMCSSADSDIKQGVYAGVMAGKILQGANPAEMPIVTPTSGTVTINGKRVKKLGLFVPFDMMVSSIVIE
ncbi:MAG: ABC transporter substrate binding protein [Candidatus Omnitrophota bacterium]